MRTWLQVLAVVAIPVALYGTLIVAKCVIGLYMLTLGGVAPGEPMGPDDLAPTFAGAMTWLIIGLLLVVASLFLRAWIRRRLRTVGTST